MKEIEGLLYDLHQSTLPTPHVETSASCTDEREASVLPAQPQDTAPARAASSVPFATIDLVHENSPSWLDGLRPGDRLLQFGDVDAENHRNLAALADVVRSSVGSAIRVVVERGGTTAELAVTPRPWAGRGVLGCLFHPIPAP
jgi:26S proteasome non-ATPase regulatory subunit 9